MPQSEESPPPTEKMNGSAILQKKEADTLRPISPSSAGSDNDGGERPVREKLKKASIGGLSQAAAAKMKPLEAETMDEKYREASDTQQASSKEESLPRGRATRKRSFDDLQNDSATTPDPNTGEDTPRRANHKRLRSRDVSGTSEGSNEKSTREQVDPVAEEEDDEVARKSPGGAGIIVDEKAGSGEKSPQKKRSRDQFDKDASTSEDTTREKDQATDVPLEGAESKVTGAVPTSGLSPAKGEPEKKRHRDATQETDATDDQTQTQPETQPETQPFEKPFGNPARAQPTPPLPKTETIPKSTGNPPETSDAAFKASGLAAFAAKSPFGSFAGAKTGSATGFGSFGSSKPATTGFGSTSAPGGPSPFAPKGAGGFGGLGSGTGFGGLGTSSFGSGGPGKSSFASPFGSSGLSLGNRGGLGSARGFGKSDDEDEDDEEESGIQTVSAGEVQDSRFQAQHMETGEEDEETLFSSRAKLYFFENKEWKERGAGNVKLNRQLNLERHDNDSDDDDDEERDDDEAQVSSVTKARLLMRTDGAHRVVLNTPIQKGLSYGSPDGSEPVNKRVLFKVSGGENPGMYMLTVSREDDARELYQQILLLQGSMA